MGFFDDFTNALETYPETGVQLEIVEVSFPDSVLNVEETATFRVKVTNRRSTRSPPTAAPRPRWAAR